MKNNVEDFKREWPMVLSLDIMENFTSFFVYRESDHRNDDLIESLIEQEPWENAHHTLMAVENQSFLFAFTDEYSIILEYRKLQGLNIARLIIEAKLLLNQL